MATSYFKLQALLPLMFGLASIITGLIGHFVFRMHLHRLQWLGMCIADVALELSVWVVVVSMIAAYRYITHAYECADLLCIYILGKKKFNAPLKIQWPKQTGSIFNFFAHCIMYWCLFIWVDLPTQMPSTKSVLALLYAVIMASLIAMSLLL